MKKSLKLLLFFIIVFLVADRFVAFSLRKIDEKVKTGQSVGKVNHFLSVKDSLDVLVFGSSRANHHVDNITLSKSSYNIGIDGTKIGNSAILISTLRKKGQNILVHVDYNTLYDSSYTGDDMLGLKNLITRNEIIKAKIRQFFPEEINLSKVSNSYVYNGKVLGMIKNYFSPNYDYRNYNGYDPLYPSDEQISIFEKLVKENELPVFTDDELDISSPSSKFDGFVDIIIDICKNNNSNLIFFTSPNLKVIDSKYRNATKSYFDSKGVKYFDFIDLVDATDISYWKDFTHMSHKGALKLTKELKTHLVFDNLD